MARSLEDSILLIDSHLYVDGERLADIETPNYVHVGRSGVTQGIALDIPLMLAHGYVAGLTFYGLKNGDVAVIGDESTAGALTASGAMQDPAFIAEMEALMNANRPKITSADIDALLEQMIASILGGGSGTRERAKANWAETHPERELTEAEQAHKAELTKGIRDRQAIERDAFAAIAESESIFEQYGYQIDPSDYCPCDDCKRERRERGIED